jgi:predicted membrane protein
MQNKFFFIICFVLVLPFIIAFAFNHINPFLAIFLIIIILFIINNYTKPKNNNNEKTN